MVLITIVVGCLVGALIGIYAPIIPYTYSGYLAIAIIAALDSVFGGINSLLKKNFDLKIFVTGFFGNAILSILNNMKEEYKSILILKYDMELSYKEIALLLGTNENVIKTYMYRARNKFKEEWRMINEQV